jgi:glycerol-3-phosphate O-acyltransferase
VSGRRIQVGHSGQYLPSLTSFKKSYVFYRLGLALPHIAAGDNLNMPVVGNILKHGGAFFIKRQWGNDPIYLAIMREYIETLLEKG